MASAVRSTSIDELQRMFSNLDSNVIASVLSANNGQIDVTIDQLLTMSIDVETTNNRHQLTPNVPLRQLPALPNLYEDDPPPYPGLVNNLSSTAENVEQSSRRTSRQGPPSISNRSSPVSQNQIERSPPREIQVQKWKTPYGHQRICYIGDLSDDFLRVKISNSTRSQSSNNEFLNIKNQNSNSTMRSDDDYIGLLLRNKEFLDELRQNKEFLSALGSDFSSSRKSSNPFSTKPLALPSGPSVEPAKTPKVRARMLQNVLTQIEQGQTMKTSMVPERSIVENESYSYGKEDKNPLPIPAAPFVNHFDGPRAETNDEFLARLKHMGKNSMEKFHHLARRFSARRTNSTIESLKSTRPSALFHRSDQQKFTNEFEPEENERHFDDEQNANYRRLKN